jgi:hypothetical protein
MYTRPDFNLGLNALGVQVKRMKKKAPIRQLLNRRGLPQAFGVNPMLTPRIISCKPNTRQKSGAEAPLLNYHMPRITSRAAIASSRYV